MQVTEQRVLPAAEAVEGYRYRQGHVDADHADLDLVGEAASGLAIAGEEAGAVAVLVIIDQRDGVFEACHAHHTKYRAEDLVTIDAHVRRDAIEQRGTHEEAGRALDQRVSAAIHDQLGASAGACLDIAGDLVALRGIDQGAHVVTGFGAWADAHGACLRRETFDQGIRGFIPHADGHRDGHAALACAAEGGPDQGAGGIVEIGVRQYHGVILGAS